MWAQLMRFGVKPGKDTAGLREQPQAVEQPDSGLLRTMIMQDQKDPEQFYTLVVFESGEKARARERSAPPGGVASPFWLDRGHRR
jgi:Antibiotic biosynthesis monooxygenase